MRDFETDKKIHVLFFKIDTKCKKQLLILFSLSLLYLIIACLLIVPIIHKLTTTIDLEGTGWVIITIILFILSVRAIYLAALSMFYFRKLFTPEMKAELAKQGEERRIEKEKKLEKERLEKEKGLEEKRKIAEEKAAKKSNKNKEKATDGEKINSASEESLEQLSEESENLISEEPQGQAIEESVEQVIEEFAENINTGNGKD